ncbi:hypothetical protein M3Y94_00055000 [Aphelenchoides besseyi]|nr:hypothetical protein M3Y94_00055000 [Aphelenchoides besseyi]KAI6217736.1 hypothetical protein M3Y95_01205700 [Aphelenchoides besseyi]
MSNRPVVPPSGPPSAKKKKPRRGKSKKPADEFFPPTCTFNIGGCNHKNDKSKANCWRLKDCVSPNMIRRQAKLKAAKKTRMEKRDWDAPPPEPTPKAPEPAPEMDSPTSPFSPESPIIPLVPANQVDTNDTVKRINIMIYTMFEGKVDEHGTPITREWYAKLVLDPNFSVKRTKKMAGSSAQKKKEMVPDKDQPVKQSSKERKKPNNN